MSITLSLTGYNIIHFRQLYIEASYAGAYV